MIFFDINRQVIKIVIFHGIRLLCIVVISGLSSCVIDSGSTSSRVACSSILSTGATKNIQVDWQVNPDGEVNKAGGGYRVLYSKMSNFNINGCPFKTVEVSYNGSYTPNNMLISVPSGATYYVKIQAYSALNTKGSELSNEISVQVP